MQKFHFNHLFHFVPFVFQLVQAGGQVWKRGQGAGGGAA